MDLLLTTKGGDATTWRAAQEFAAAYQKTLFDQVASDHCGSAESVFSAASATLETAIATHLEAVKRLENLIAEVAAARLSTNISELTITFYTELYRYFDHFRSAPAFYQLSMTFLRQASAAIIAHTTDQLGLFARHLPEMSLIAVGPAGRAEYSPFCPLQILLVHGEITASQTQTINLFCHTLHDGFVEAGFSLDPVITPRTPSWRGTEGEWHKRCEDALLQGSDDTVINLCRLVDQYPLTPAEGFAVELKNNCHATLNGSRPSLANLIGRTTALSNGLNLMGRFKLERGENERGLFRLLDHGLLPLSAALSALALIKESPAVSTCERIRDLLKRGELDVELAERMLATWHSLHGLCLQREQMFHVDEHSTLSLLLNPEELTVRQRHTLKEALESVAIIQRHLAITFSGMGE